MLTQSRIKELFDYDPCTGEFRYRIARGSRKAGELAGNSHSGGYLTITVDYRQVYAHRAAFLWMTGSVPDEVDHADGNRVNNAFSNLRAASRSANASNTIIRSDNTTGKKGILLERGRRGMPYVRAVIHHKGKRYTAAFTFAKYGEEKAKSLAEEWIVNKRVELHGEFACHGSRSSPI